MEKRDLYNYNRELIGKTIYKNEKIPDGCYILMIVIFIENNKNEFLIQKRSITKGGQWAFTGGHPKTGENSLQGLYSEVKEELGIIINTPVCFKSANGKITLCDMYYVKQDIDLTKIKLQKEEVQEVKLATIKEIDSLYKNNEFKKGHYMMFKDCLNYINNLKG